MQTVKNRKVFLKNRGKIILRLLRLSGRVFFCRGSLRKDLFQDLDSFPLVRVGMDPLLHPSGAAGISSARSAIKKKLEPLRGD